MLGYWSPIVVYKVPPLIFSCATCGPLWLLWIAVGLRVDSAQSSRKSSLKALLRPSYLYHGQIRMVIQELKNVIYSSMAQSLFAAMLRSRGKSRQGKGSFEKRAMVLMSCSRDFWVSWFLGFSVSWLWGLLVSGFLLVSWLLMFFSWLLARWLSGSIVFVLLVTSVTL